MDLHLTEEQTAFRQEVRDFLDKELPSDWIGGPISFANVDQGTEMKWRKMLGRKGLEHHRLAQGVWRPGRVPHDPAHF